MCCCCIGSFGLRSKRGMKMDGYHGMRMRGLPTLRAVAKTGFRHSTNRWTLTGVYEGTIYISHGPLQIPTLDAQHIDRLPSTRQFRRVMVRHATALQSAAMAIYGK